MLLQYCFEKPVDVSKIGNIDIPAFIPKNRPPVFQCHRDLRQCAMLPIDCYHHVTVEDDECVAGLPYTRHYDVVQIWVAVMPVFRGNNADGRAAGLLGSLRSSFHDAAQSAGYENGWALRDAPPYFY